MTRYLLCLFIIFGFIQTSIAQDQKNKPKISKVKKKKSKSSKELIADVFQDFQSGKYQDVIDTLLKLEKKFKKGTKKYNELLGLIYYWRGMAYSRLSDYRNAETNFAQAIKLKYKSVDLFYEYGQVLYVADRLKKARIAFKRSFKKGYKKGVSLYYIAFISQELKDYKKAVSFYSMIEKLKDEDKKDVIQAARMQVGDIYLEKIERLPDSFKDVEKYVIPQYQKALKWDEESALAGQIKTKIENLQRKYELVLFRMRNGRPTSRPPYYMRANLTYGSDSNATRAENPTSEDAATYTTAGFFGRYSFYANDAFSYAPEINITTQQWSTSNSSIYALNNYNINTALKMNYEHMYNNAPATFFFDISYGYRADASVASADNKREMAFADSTVAVVASEELQFWKGNPSTFRLRYAQVTAENETQNSTNTVFNYEQIIGLGRTTLFLFNSFDQRRMADAAQNSADTDTLTNRLDAIFPTFFGLFNPTLYVSNTAINNINNSDTGTTNLSAYGINLNRPLGGNFFGTLDISQSTQTGKQDADNFSQQVIFFNLDYIL